MPHKANAARRHHIPRPKRRVTNWSEYNESLRQRGSLTVWFTDEAIAAWKAALRTTPGGQPHYSDLAITTAYFRILDFHLERLADIALTVPEPGHDQPLSFSRELQGAIELRNISFRYADSEPYILENINLTIEPGQFITIAGASGGGKTTLIKIMLGI